MFVLPVTNLEASSPHKDQFQAHSGRIENARTLSRLIVIGMAMKLEDNGALVKHHDENISYKDQQTRVFESSEN